MTKLISILAQDRSIDLKEPELVELIEAIKASRGYIYPHKFAEESGFTIHQIEKLLLKLATESYLKHFIVPKYKDKLLLEEAKEGFNFENFHEVLNKEEGYFDESLNNNIILLSAYKKNA